MHPQATPYQRTMAKALSAPLYPDRTGTGRMRYVGEMERYDLRNGQFPADTTNQMFLVTLIKEVLGFISGSNKIEDLGVSFWDKWSPKEEDVDAYLDYAEANSDEKTKEIFAANRENSKAYLMQYVGTIGPMYGTMWRDFPRAARGPLSWVNSIQDIPSDKLKRLKEKFAAGIFASGRSDMNTEEHFFQWAIGEFSQTFDQLAYVMKNLRLNPYSSRHRITAFHPDLIGEESVSPKFNVLSGKAALSPCHSNFQFLVTDEDGEKHLNCVMFMSSSDIAVGRRYNICQYSLMTHLIAHCLGYKTADFILMSADTHLYADHIENAKIQIEREPLPYAKVILNPEQKDLFAFTREDITIEGYQHHDRLDYKASV